MLAAVPICSHVCSHAQACAVMLCQATRSHCHEQPYPAMRHEAILVMPANTLATGNRLLHGPDCTLSILILRTPAGGPVVSDHQIWHSSSSYQNPDLTIRCNRRSD